MAVPPRAPILGPALTRTLVATACFGLIALALGGRAVVGQGSLGPDVMMDVDPLYGVGSGLQQPLPSMNDPTPIALDWPRDRSFARGLHAGRVEQWNPLAGCGAPLWAEQGGPFFPLKAPFYLLPSRAVYEAFLISRLVLAALGAYFLARFRGLTAVGATAAGATFELSQVLMYQVRFGVYSNMFVLPWVLLAGNVLGRRRSPAAAAGAAVVLGIATSAGHPGLAILVVGAFAASMAAAVLSSWRSPRAMAVLSGWSGIALLLGLALAAPTLLPLAELMTLATSYKFDAIGQTVHSGGTFGARLALPLSLFLPGFARPGAELGLLGLVASMVGVVAGGLDASLVAVGLFGAAVSLAPMGLGWISELPGLRWILPFYGFALVVFPLTQAAGRGVEVLGTLSAGRSIVACVASVAACLGVWLLSGVAPSTVVTVLGRREVVVGMLLSAAASAVILGVARGLWLARFPGIAVVMTALIVGERLAVAVPLIHQPASIALTTPPRAAVRFLQDALSTHDARMIGVPHRVGYPLTPMLFGLPDIRSFSALPMRRYLAYLRAADPSPEPVRDIFDQAAQMVVQYVNVTSSALLDLASVRYVVVPNRGSGTPPPLLEDDALVRLAFSDPHVLIYENLHALPRVRIAHRAIPMAGEDAALAWARQTGASRRHARELGLDQTLVVEPDEQGRLPPPTAGDPSPLEDARIVDQGHPDRLSVEVRLETPGFLVIADSYHPGWKAWLDGMPTSIHPADLLFRAVSVPAGEHRVELRYRPRAFVVGVVVFTISAVVCAWLLLAGRAGTGS